MQQFVHMDDLYAADFGLKMALATLSSFKRAPLYNVDRLNTGMARAT